MGIPTIDHYGRKLGGKGASNHAAEIIVNLWWKK
jgi:hypothetical protein